MTSAVTVFTRTIRASNNLRCSFLACNNLNNFQCAARLFSFSNNSRFQLFNHHSGASACNFVAIRLSRCGEISWPTCWPRLCSCLPWPSQCCVAWTREFPSRQHQEERQNALSSGIAYCHRSLMHLSMTCPTPPHARKGGDRLGIYLLVEVPYPWVQFIG